jgi:membrane fusion protein (multidrug efflux system)
MKSRVVAIVVMLATAPAWGQATSGRIETARPPVNEAPKTAAPVEQPPSVPDKGNSPAYSSEREISVLVVAGQETVLSSQMPGKIKKISVGLGDNVRSGVRLLEFDCAEQEAQLQAALAEYRGARETHLTKLKLQALGAAGELEVTVAAAGADKAKSQVTFRESQLAYCGVPAPFSGRVAKIRVKPAESVSLGQPLLDMVNPGSLKAQLYVPASWIQWVRPGTTFQVKVADDGRTYKARVSKLNARVEGVSQAIEIEGRFEGNTQWLLPGMVGQAIFPSRPNR